MHAGTFRNGRRALFLAAVIMLGAPGMAGAQFFLPYASDSYSNAVLDTLSLAEQAEEAIDGNHRRIARWFLSFSVWGVRDIEESLPNEPVIKGIAKTIAYINEGKTGKALKIARRCRAELQKLSRFWKMEEAEAKLAEVIELLERGDSDGAREGARAIEKLVRLDPLQARLDDARAQLQKAKKRQEEGRDMEALEALTNAKYSLRRAYLAARLTQVRMMVMYSLRELEKGNRWGARWAMRRSARKLKSGRYMATDGEADALSQISRDIDEARAMLAKKDSRSREKLELVEAKIDAALRNIGT